VRPPKARPRSVRAAILPGSGYTGRHTFISMHVAPHESIEKTALEADNTAAVI
jgi:hypothetical protein